jgi:glutathione synthase/RimK-type ligase-like ATP-grasp enzyme
VSKDHIVVFTQMDDPHSDDVIMSIGQLGHEVIRLNTDDITANVNVSLTLDMNKKMWSGKIKILTNSRSIDLDSIRSIWWRRPGAFVFPSDFSLQERVFSIEETQHVLNGIWASLDCYWISHPENIRQANWKGEQLKRAIKFGFEVPRTLITTNPVEARRFYEACSRKVIYKVLSDPYLGANKLMELDPESIPEDTVTHATLIMDENSGLLDVVGIVPCLFQEYVEKKLEYRITVVGDEVFVAEIHSQDQEDTKIDWRAFNEVLPIQSGTLPLEVIEQCLTFVKSYNLNYSAMDLILTPEGRYVFLENNPNGQYMFVQQLVPSLQITEAIIECLILGRNRDAK